MLMIKSPRLRGGYVDEQRLFSFVFVRGKRNLLSLWRDRNYWRNARETRTVDGRRSALNGGSEIGGIGHWSRFNILF